MDKFRKKYKKDIEYISRQFQPLPKKAYKLRVPKRELLQAKAEIAAQTAKTQEIAVKAGKRYLMKYDGEVIEGRCIWTAGEYFDFKDGAGTRSFRKRYVESMKEVK